MTFSDGILFETAREVWFEEGKWEDYGYPDDGLCFEFTTDAFNH